MIKKIKKFIITILSMVLNRLCILLGLIFLALVSIRSPKKALEIIQDWANREREIEENNGVSDYVKDLQKLIEK